MKLTHVYRIKPTTEQIAIMDLWMELLRRHWNYSLGQRLDWLRRSRCQIDRCSLISEPIGDLPGRFPNYNLQSGDLKQTKELFPDYRNIYHDVQQQNLKRLEKAWERWIKKECRRGRIPPPNLRPDNSGRRGGRPRFKKQGDLRSFTFPRINSEKAGANIKGDALTLSKIGTIPIILHRPLPDGFVPKTCTIVKRADGWCACISLADDTIPQSIPLDEVKTATGIDVGLKEFLTDASGNTESIQQNFRRSQKRLARRGSSPGEASPGRLPYQRASVHKQKGSNNAQKQKNRIARIHQRIKRQRQEFHYKVAHKLVKTYDLIGVEDLNIKGLAKTKLAKSVLDAAWWEFLTILEAVAARRLRGKLPPQSSLVKRGVRVVKVKPHGTTVDCSTCGWKVPKTLEIRIHNCPNCSTVLDRDHNAAINILERAIKDVGLTFSACGGYLSWVTRQVGHLVRADEPGISSREVGSLHHTA